MQVSVRHLVRVCVVFVLGVALVTFTSGCGRGKGDVSGEVTVNGKPLPSGMIVFTPADGPAVAAEIVDGKYSAVGVTTGEVKVSLDLNSLKQSSEQRSKGGGGMATVGAERAKQKSMNPGKMADLPAGAKEYYAKQAQTNAEAGRRTREAIGMMKDIPEKYLDPNSSGWTLSVSRGGNTFDAKVTK